MSDPTPDSGELSPHETVSPTGEWDPDRNRFYNGPGDELVILPSGRTLVSGQELIYGGQAMSFEGVTDDLEGWEHLEPGWYVQAVDVDSPATYRFPVDSSHHIEKIARPGGHLRRRADGSLIPSSTDRKRRIAGALDALEQLLAEVGEWKLTRWSALADRLGVHEVDLRNALNGPAARDPRFLIEGGGHGDDGRPGLRTFKLAEGAQ